ncbi:MAG: hypothetical protein K2W94_06045 [Alphaproteobacteria bacterium]|nr:hypothetical protein [Alphaproteobacteria bacterium]
MKIITILVMLLSFENLAHAVDAGLLESTIDELSGILRTTPSPSQTAQRSQVDKLIEECTSVEPITPDLPLTITEMQTELVGFFKAEHTPSQHEKNVRNFLTNAHNIFSTYKSEITSAADDEEALNRVAGKMYCLHRMVEEVKSNFLKDSE